MKRTLLYLHVLNVSYKLLYKINCYAVTCIYCTTVGNYNPLTKFGSDAHCQLLQAIAMYTLMFPT